MTLDPAARIRNLSEGPRFKFKRVAAAAAFVLAFTCACCRAQNVIVDHGDIFYRSGSGRTPYPPEYSAADVVFEFATGKNPFPGGRFADVRIVCRDAAVDGVERSPAVVPQEDGRPGFWTALKKGATYDFYWMWFAGGRSKFGSWTVPSDAPRCVTLTLTLDGQANVTHLASTALAPTVPAVSATSDHPTAAAAATSARAMPSSPAPEGKRVLGRFFGRASDGVVHYWDFNADGTFLHRWIAGGAMSRVSNSERGRFTQAGNDITLSIERAATAFSQSSASQPGGQVYGGGAHADPSVRHATVQFQSVPSANDPVLVLDGVPLKPRHF